MSQRPRALGIFILVWFISSGGKEVGAFGFCEGADEPPDGIPKSIACAFCSLAKQGLELRERLLDGIEVGAVGRQKAQLGTRSLDRGTDLWPLVDAQIVHDDDIAEAERRGEELFDPGEEGGAVHRALENERRGQAAEPEPGDEGGRVPVPVRDRGMKPLAARTPPVEPRHLRIQARLVHEDQFRRVEIGLARGPCQPGRRYVLALLLFGVTGLFLRVIPRRSKNFQSRPMLT